MDYKKVKSFIKKHGVVLGSANGPVPKLTDFIAEETINGSWWGHAKGHEIFNIFNTMQDDLDLLMCRLINGKITVIHKRVWPAIVRLSSEIDKKHIAKVIQEHTASGKHIRKDIPYPKWVPEDVFRLSKTLTKKEASELLGKWYK